jgi:RNA polymerase sigma factor (sigma-70 family)
MKRMPTDGAGAELQARVRAALAQLPDDQRQVIELTLFAGLTQRAIAARLRCAEADVPRLARLALQTVREIINHSAESHSES